MEEIKASQKQSIMENLNNLIYSLFDIPRVLYIDNDGIYVNKDSPNQDPMAALNDEIG